MNAIINKLSEELKIKENQAVETIKLLDEGSTVPFIARYRKEKTGGLSDEVLRNLEKRLDYLRNLEARKGEVIRLIDEQGKLSDDLKAEIEKADILQRVEDLYRPYRQKRKTRASTARARGLEPLAMLIFEQTRVDGDIESLASGYVNEELEISSTGDALKGAVDIIAEIISDDAAYREWIRDVYFKRGIIISCAVDRKNKSVYEMYYEYEEDVRSIANHRVLAINRGEKNKILKIDLKTPDEEVERYLKTQIIKNSNATGIEYLTEAISDAYKRLMSPSIEREVRSFLTERAEEEAILVFAKNTKPLLMVPPVRNVRILSIDPGIRTGCKLTVLDETGKLIDYATVYPHEPFNKTDETVRVMKSLIEKYDIDVIPIGNGTASRETEQVVADMLDILEKEVFYTFVSEAGASVYSASKLATEEYPDVDVSIRGAISIGRRLQDPLAELVKIDPKHIGVGQYQHDLNQTKLDEALKRVVEDCVNSVGADLNTASPSLLKYISGISNTVAKNIVQYREKNGKYVTREQLKKVKGIGTKAFEQCAGFLKIAGGDNPLDNTSVHPESYEITHGFIELLGYGVEIISKSTFEDLDSRILEYEMDGGRDTEDPGKKPAKNNLLNLSRKLDKIAGLLGTGYLTLKDIVEELKKPGRDPRDEMPKPVFRSDVVKMEDLKVGMILTGTVRNVVDFGSFVDIGVKQDGLVHISELSDRYVKHPMDVVSVGDHVKVRIINVDLERGKISLSMKGVG
jgi:uncharacterized protein